MKKNNMKKIIDYIGRKRFNMFDWVMMIIGIVVLILSNNFWYWLGFVIFASILQIILDYYYDKQKLEDELDEEQLESEWLKY